jgi:2-oxoglutarate dehydrogenase E2 component (dihydrolipoamide succinyltransferase)
MGESIAEGTIVRWLKKPGDTVDRDEPLFEISTDKVDAEVPSPAAGVLIEIRAQEGETVPVDSVVATIGAPEEPYTSAAPGARSDVTGAEREEPTAPPGEAASGAAGPQARSRWSPLVRRLAEEHSVDLREVRGTGSDGRVTKRDVLGYLREKREGIRDQGAGIRDQGSGIRDQGSGIRERGAGLEPDARVEVRPLSVMRRKIAEHMVMSRRTSAHAHSVFHVDFSTVRQLRRQTRAEYEQRGVKLTYLAFIAKAVVNALRSFPVVNASLDGDNVLYKKDINLGIAVALDDGLIVPVIMRADGRNLLELTRSIADLADRARSKRLKPEEVHHGTFTITNPGQFGSQFGMPIINQPQVAILGVGTIEQRPVVVEDTIAIRPMAYLTLGYDHRLIDGATGDRFLAEIKEQIERFDPNQL